jgi:hypothetical protein
MTDLLALREELLRVRRIDPLRLCDAVEKPSGARPIRNKSRGRPRSRRRPAEVIERLMVLAAKIR